MSASRYFADAERVRAIPPQRVTELMLELLDLTSADKLLEIGTGSATQTAEFAKHCTVHTIELNPIRYADHLGDHVHYWSGDGANGLPGEAPFTAIAVCCGVRDIPDPWISQLSDGGRLCAPVGGAESQRLTLFRKSGELLEPVRVGAYVRFSMMEEKK